MKKIIILLTLVLSLNYGFSQDTTATTKQAMTNKSLPYSEIPKYDALYNPGNIIRRMVDGLGYRYYWATDGLREADLSYQPSKDARSTRATLEHVCGLSETILNAAKNVANVRPVDWSGLSFSELRSLTIKNLKEASDLFKDKTAVEIAELHVIFERNNKQNAFPFWNMINGQISDALYHTGQLVSFRRASGNPMNPNVNVFIGKNNVIK